MPTPKIRTIIRTARFQQEMNSIEPDVRRADEFLEGVETILARRPQSGFALKGSSVWFVPGHTVDLSLYYAFDDNHVYFLSIKKITPPSL